MENLDVSVKRCVDLYGALRRLGAHTAAEWEMVAAQANAEMRYLDMPPEKRGLVGHPGCMCGFTRSSG